MSLTFPVGFIFSSGGIGNGPGRLGWLTFLGFRQRSITEIGASLGLPRPSGELEEAVFQRGAITIIRQNWHILPEEQIISLLGWDRSFYERVLREEDFLWHKLGDQKPACLPLHYHTPTPVENEVAGKIAGQVRAVLCGEENASPGEAPYAFLRRSSAGSTLPPGPADAPTGEGISLLHSYFSTCGDILLEKEHTGFPPAYLDQLAKAGVKALWIPVVLSTLAPSEEFPEFGERWEERIENLRALVARTKERGLRLFLYLNEPRAMPPAFFDHHPDVQGAPFRELVAICTSVPRVRKWIFSSLAHVVREVPDIGGFFTITMSENHTNCFSHGGAWGKGAPDASGCPRCSQRTSWETLAELAHLFRDAIRSVSSKPELIFWDWGWGDRLSRHLIPLLPKDVYLQSMSEYDVPFSPGERERKGA